MFHEKLICYRKALKLAEELTQETLLWPRGQGYLVDQLKRALASVVLNCAEGNSKISAPDRKRFFQIARGSICEVGACLDLGRIFGLIKASKVNDWKVQCEEISKILFSLP